MSAEASILNVILRDNSAISKCFVLPEHFENLAMGSMLAEVKSLIGERIVVDAIVLAERMQAKTGRDWLTMITEVMTNGAAPSNFESYCELVTRSHLEREAKAVAQSLLESAGSQEAINAAVRSLMMLGRSSGNYEYSSDEALKIGLESIDRAIKNKGAIQGVDTGLKDLNEVLGGFHPGDLVIFGARPAMGKTSILLNMLMGAAARVGLFSGEQGIEQIAQRLISIESTVPLMKMRNGAFGEDDYPKLEFGARKIKQHTGIQFFDKSSPSIEDIENTARKWKFEYDIKGIYVDYIQKIKIDTSNKNKAQAVGENAGRLKDLARELEIPVVALAQVSRKVEDRTNRRPLMGDLADSSELEKEADQIIMLYRDEVYNPDTQFPGIMELLIEKNRHGATGMISAVWEGKYLGVRDMVKPNAI